MNFLIAWQRTFERNLIERPLIKVAFKVILHSFSKELGLQVIKDKSLHFTLERYDSGDFNARLNIKLAYNWGLN